MNSPLISIIVPVYNVEQYLRQCLDSLINQTYKNIEIIVVNDGSTDNSQVILEEYACRDFRVKIFKQDNQGLSGARNSGISNCKGEYIMFVDSDDWLQLDTCEKALFKALEYKTDIVLFSYVREFESSSLPKYILGEDTYFHLSESNKLRRLLVGPYQDQLNEPEQLDTIVTACIKLYNSELIKDVSFTPTKDVGTEDALFNLEAFYGVKSAYYIHEPLYHYRKTNNESLTSTYKPRLADQWEELFRRMKVILDKESLSSDFYEALDNRAALSIIGLGLNLLGSDYSHPKKIKILGELISRESYRKSIAKLKLSYLPIHWRILFCFAKYRVTLGLYFMLLAVKFMIGRG